MPRRPRLDQPGQPQHFIQRGNNRGACFFTDDDYYCYLYWLRRAAADHHLAVHAYARITNHMHVLVTPAMARALATMMQSLGRARRSICERHPQAQRHAVGGSFSVQAVDAEEYLLWVYRHIELNPLRANVAAYPHEYR